MNSDKNLMTGLDDGSLEEQNDTIEGVDYKLQPMQSTAPIYSQNILGTDNNSAQASAKGSIAQHLGKRAKKGKKGKKGSFGGYVMSSKTANILKNNFLK